MTSLSRSLQTILRINLDGTFWGASFNLGGIDCSVTWYGIVMHVSVVVIGGTFLHYSLKNIDFFGRGDSRNQI